MAIVDLIVGSCTGPDLNFDDVLGTYVQSPLVSASLNDSQLHGVVQAQRKRFSLIQGPPGTGKTNVAAEILMQWLLARDGCDRMQQRTILAAAFTNAASQNLMECLLQKPEISRFRLLFVGHVDDETPNWVTQRSLPDTTDPHVYLSRADLIFTTIMYSANRSLRDMTFPLQLIDEAAQAIEPDALVPLTKSAHLVCLVGDHQQLPAVVTSRLGKELGLSISLFERLADTVLKPTFLDMQYRSHKALIQYSNDTLYEDRIVTVTDLAPAAGFDWPRSNFPLAIIDAAAGVDEVRIVTRKNRKAETSWKNDYEARITVRVVHRFIEALGSVESVGVITPYASQCEHLKSMLPEGVKVSSVDGFQGQEREVIVMSVVRAHPECNINFIADPRRLNVSFTRARAGFVLISKLTLLQRFKTLRGWLSDMRDLHPSPILSSTLFLDDGQ